MIIIRRRRTSSTIDWLIRKDFDITLAKSFKPGGFMICKPLYKKIALFELVLLNIPIQVL